MRKPIPQQPRVRLEDLPTRELIARGVALLSDQNYKDAIDVYKLLLKREPQPEAGWRDSLAKVYLERARQLAQKAMHREAAVLWENIPTLCGQTPQPDLYLDWLLRSGQYAKAMRAYASHAAALPAGGELETLLAALALAGQKEVLQAIPPDAPLFAEWRTGRFAKPTDVMMAWELLRFLEALTGITSVIKSDHILNLLPEVDGRLPQDQERLVGTQPGLDHPAETAGGALLVVLLPGLRIGHASGVATAPP